MMRALLMLILIIGTCGYFSPLLFNNHIYTTMISLSIFPGVVIAYALKIPYTIGGVIFGLISLLLVNMLKINYNANILLINNIGFIMFSLGLILVSKIKSNIDLDSLLFGFPLSISSISISEFNAKIFISLFILLCLIIMQIISIPFIIIYIIYVCLNNWYSSGRNIYGKCIINNSWMHC